MISVIIHVDDSQFLDRTLKSVLLATPSSLLTEIILVDDTGLLPLEYGVPSVRVLTMDSPVGRAVARNRGAAAATGEYLVFLDQVSRPCDDWVVPLLESLKDDPRTLAGPVICGLDPNLWSAEPVESLKWAWGWDLAPKKAYDDGQSHSVSLGVECLAILSSWFRDLGGFDELSRGGEQQEFCLRVWLCGGRVVPVRESRVACLGQPSVPDVVTQVRTAEAWFGPVRDRFYTASGLTDGMVDPGNIGQLAVVSAGLQVRDARWFVDRYMPELGRIYELSGVHRGKSIAVVCDGPSLSRINKWMIRRHEVIIGVDFVAEVVDCHYVVSLQREAVRHLLMGGKYFPNQLVLPSVLLGPDGRGHSPTRDAAPAAVTYELGEPGAPPLRLEPPFVNYGHPVLTAVQLAGFMGAGEVVLYGWDGRVVDGMSHTDLVEHYNGGRYWDDGDMTRRRFQYYNAGLEHLRRLLAGRGVSVLKVSYV